MEKDDIKKKIKKNPKYLHPCNKERQEDMKRLGFVSGYEYICWLKQIGAIKNCSDIEHEYRNKLARIKGYKNDTDRRKADGDRLARELGYESFKDYAKELRYERGKILPAEFNENCPANFGLKTEKLIEKFLFVIFEYVERTDYHDKGIDFFCKNPRKEFIEKYPQFNLEINKEYRIQHRSQCLTSNNSWIFGINYDQINDYFLLSAWKDRKSLEAMHLWLIHRDEKIRKRRLWQYVGLGITNNTNNLKEFSKYEITDIK